MLYAKDIMELINEAESKFPVEEWTIGNVHIWPLVRFDIFFQLLPQTVNTKSEKSNREILRLGRRPLWLLKNLFTFLYAICVNLFRHQDAQEGADAVFLSDGSSCTWLNGAWYENFCDPFISGLRGKNMSSFLLTPTYQYFLPRHTKASFILPDLAYIMLKNRFFGNNAPVYAENIRDFDKFLDFLKKKRISLELPDLKQIRAKVSFIKECSSFYKKILKRLDPRFGFRPCYYGVQGMAFNLACHECGVLSVDIQHGFQVNEHVAYGSWSKVPVSGYELLPAIFWCWSENEASFINQWSRNIAGKHKPIAGGNLLLQIWKEGKEDFVSFFDQKIAEVKENHKNCVHILFTLNTETETEIKQLTSLIRTVNERRLPYYFWIRVHPCRLSQKAKFKRILSVFKEGNIELEKTTGFPLHALLRNIDVHITEFSSTVIEAVDFGVPSVVIHPTGAKIFKDQLASGWAQEAYDTEEIIASIQAQAGKREQLIRSRAVTQESKTDGLDTLLNLTSQKR